MEMPFGKYKGMDLRDVPLGYLKWIEENLNLRQELREDINWEINRRTSNTPNQGRDIKK